MPSFNSGFFVAKDRDTGVHLSSDQFEILDKGSYFEINSVMTVYGAKGFNQSAKFITSKDWMPTELLISIDSHNTHGKFIFRKNETEMEVSVGDKISRQMIPRIDNTIQILLTGSLFIPFIWVKQFQYNSTVPIDYQIVPSGTTRVQLLKNTQIKGCDYVLEGLMTMGNATDRIIIGVDNNKNIQKVYSSNLNLEIDCKYYD